MLPIPRSTRPDRISSSLSNQSPLKENPAFHALYAVVMEFWAASEAALAAFIVPVTTPGGKPVIEVAAPG